MAEADYPSAHSVSPGLQEQVTLLIHGTFANPQYVAAEGTDGPDVQQNSWWRLTEQGEGDTTADRLRTALADHDPSLAATMWREGGDPRDGDLSYRELCEWSGDNTHKARKKAAKTLATSLEDLATRRGSSGDDPLVVNLVAHSHGGNVVLDALKHLSEKVRPRQVCLLGTPLTWRFFDPRWLYVGIFTPAVLALVYAFWNDANFGFLDLTDSPELFDTEVIFDLIAGGLLLSALLWLFVGIHGVIRRVFGVFHGWPAYGFRPKKLEKALHGRPAVLFMSPEDEADLMLQVGAAPLDAYRAMIRGRPTLKGVRTWKGRLVRSVLRVSEILWVRPIAYVALIPVVEIVLERYGLGFPWLQVATFNFEMVTWTGAKTYQDTQIMTRLVSPTALEKRVLNVGVGSERRIPPATKASRRPGTEANPVRIEALRHTLLETVKGLKKQVQLRHSGYYESREIIDEVARAIAAAPQEQPASVGRTKPDSH